ncbi:MAG TPA: sulfurtransferase [Solibacterales bacterium]|nr:sulfurtransferase [Bryobacterales bacterium]
MHGIPEFLIRYGYLLLFGVVLAEQIGLPIPATPMLLAAGALAGIGKLSLASVMAMAVMACLIGDLIWFELGRTRGSSILRLLCRISLEPDTCVRKTETSYARYGAASLLFAKFIPGLSTVAPPMAAIFKVPAWRFLLLDGAGSTLWSGAFVLLGWIFRAQLEGLAMSLSRFGAWLLAAVLLIFAAYVAFKYVQRRRILRDLRIARITPVELKERLDAGESVTIIDLRDSIEWDGGKIPGALQINHGALEAAIPALPSQDEIVLYCSCPNEVTSARSALQIKRHGVSRVRPLEGGFELWRDLGFPVV